MPTTTKMGIVYPASTDLVKDGATAMGTISTTVDAKTGMVLLNTTNLTAVSSVSVNDVFSANYDAYKILFYINTSSFGDGNVRMRLRVSGADNSTANYFTQNNGFTDFNATDNFRESSATDFFVMGTDAGTTTAHYHTRLDVFNPFNSVKTTMTGQSASMTGSGAQAIFSFGSLFNAATSFTGFTLSATSGSFGTGKVLTYGYNQ